MDSAVVSLHVKAASDRLGTRFRVFPQPPFIPGYETPETIWISTPPDKIQSGPADRRIYVVDPVLDKPPYEFPYLPPFRGQVHPPAEAGPDGHFDHLQVEDRTFWSAHTFACARRVLDVCESYLGGEIPWFFAETYDRLEIVPWLRWDNAQSGYGFLEMGEDFARGQSQPFALNFDAVAHEMGHLVLFGAMGLASKEPPHEYYAYHEAIADFIGLLSLLHFDTVLDHLLRRTRGNLFVANELDRFAELSDEKQVRLFNHSLKLRDVGEEVHDLSRPFGGALFDLLVEVYQTLLYERGLTDLDPRDFWDLRTQLPAEDLENALHAVSEEYGVRHFAFKSCLQQARDIVGEMVVGSWRIARPQSLTFRTAASAICAFAETGSDDLWRELAEQCFAWRGIL